MPKQISLPLHTSQTYCALILTLINARDFAHFLKVEPSTISSYVSGRTCIARHKEIVLRRIIHDQIHHVRKHASRVGHVRVVRADMVEREAKRRFPAMFTQAIKRGDIEQLLVNAAIQFGGCITRAYVIQSLAQDDDADTHPQIRTTERIADELGFKRRNGVWSINAALLEKISKEPVID